MKCKRFGGIATRRTMRGLWVRCSIKQYVKDWQPSYEGIPRRRAGRLWVVEFLWVGKVAEIDPKLGTVRMSRVIYVNDAAQNIGFMHKGVYTSKSVWFDTCREITEKERIAWSM